MTSNMIQKIILSITGVVIISLGINVGFGGIKTLGWQNPREFLSIADPAVFAVQDSHMRFLGGIWTGIGVIFVLAGLALNTFRNTIILLCITIFAAGLFRLGAPDFNADLLVKIGPSLVFELVGFPLMAFWLYKSKSSQQQAHLQLDTAL